MTRRLAYAIAGRYVIATTLFATLRYRRRLLLTLYAAATLTLPPLRHYESYSALMATPYNAIVITAD